MKLSEVGLMQTALCKQADAAYSELFEIMKLNYSPNRRMVYIRITFGMLGQNTGIQHYWREVADLDAKWEVVDILDGEDLGEN